MAISSSAARRRPTTVLVRPGDMMLEARAKSKARALVMMTALPIASAVAQQPATPASPQAILVGSDSLVGGTVRDNEGRDIGKVSRLMIDPNDGRITSIIIATGGTLGIGSNTISVPWGSVKIGQDRGKLIVTASQTLESAPGRASTSSDQQRKQ